MNRIVIYYSLEGNTEYVANKMASYGFDVLKIDVAKPYPKKGLMMYFHSGKDAMSAASPALRPYTFDASKYDLIVFGTPVWARDFAAPLRTFICENREGLRGKRFAVYTGYRGGGTEKTAAKLAAFLGIAQFEKQLILVDPKAKQSPEKDLQIEEFCRSF